MHDGTRRLGVQILHTISPQREPCASDGSFHFPLFRKKKNFADKCVGVEFAHSRANEMVFRGWFCVTQQQRKKNSLPMQKYFRKRDFSAISVILHSIFQITLGRDELALVAVERDMMPGIQLIKFSFFELLSANFTRFASVHFRVLRQNQAPSKSVPKTGEKFPNFLGWKWGRMGPRGEMINAITFVGVEKELSRKKRSAWEWVNKNW